MINAIATRFRQIMARRKSPIGRYDPKNKTRGSLALYTCIGLVSGILALLLMTSPGPTSFSLLLVPCPMPNAQCPIPHSPFPTPHSLLEQVELLPVAISFLTHPNCNQKGDGQQLPPFFLIAGQSVDLCLAKRRWGQDYANGLAE